MGIGWPVITVYPGDAPGAGQTGWARDHDSPVRPRRRICWLTGFFQQNDYDITTFQRKVVILTATLSSAADMR